MRLSTRTRYGVRLLLDLAERFGKGPIQLPESAERTGISVKYLGQIILPLKSAGLVRSQRGAAGGYMLERDPETVTILDIYEAIEGPLHLIDCLGETPCPQAEACAVQTVWAELQECMHATLGRTTLGELVRRQHQTPPSYAI